MTENVRVWELQGADLDLLVAQAIGLKGARVVDGVCMIARSQLQATEESLIQYQPTTSWSDAGPILEQYEISVWRYPDLDSWHAATDFDFVRSEGLKVKNYCQGAKPLVAAMRTFVASKFWNDPPEAQEPGP